MSTCVSMVSVASLSKDLTMKPEQEKFGAGLMCHSIRNAILPTLSRVSNCLKVPTILSSLRIPGLVKRLPD
ncbi:hypothetical protein RJT34_16802 [Clitoria ternatea]|uniref:Uncharacterized protein n=1 Tax=Clitoria ternatea TaxID=43366 RepID=A0AAN9J9W6_CLITE